jgi:hypothetical protein
MPAFLVGLLPLVSSLFEKLIPDPEARAKEQAAFVAQLTAAATQADANQNAINLEEARHRSIFVAGWRPMIGWVCSAGCAWAWVLEPVTRFVLDACGVTVQLPVPDTASMYSMLMGLLGMAGFRTLERVQQVIPGTRR